MRDSLRWIGYLLLTAVVVVIVIFAFYRLRGPSQAQREALAIMQKDRRPDHGTNAFPLLWFMQYDVPDAEMETRMAEDIATVRKRLAESDAQVSTYRPTLKKLAEADADPKPLCENRGAGCLAKVSADAGAAQRALANFPRALARDAAFERTDFYWDDFPLDFRAILFAYPGNAQRVWLTAYALRYVGGDRAGALADVCTNLGTWRRLHRDTNSLVGAMIAISRVDGDILLIADMLAGAPLGEPVPDACASALGPIVGQDVDRCGEMIAEFAFSRNTIDYLAAHAQENWLQHFETWMTYDAGQVEAWSAEYDAKFCGDAAIRRMLDDVPVGLGDVRPVTRRMECIASISGCMLSEIAWPAYIGYDERTLDYAAHLRLAASLLWLRQQPDDDISRVFERRPEALRSVHHKSGFDEKTGAIFVENMNAQKDANFELPVRSKDRAATTRN